MRTPYKACIVLISSLLLNVGCSQSTKSIENSTKMTETAVVDYENIIPLPVVAEKGSEYFVLAKTEQILVSASQPKLMELAAYLSKEISSQVRPSIEINVMSEQKLLDVELSKFSNGQNKISLFVKMRQLARPLCISCSGRSGTNCRLYWKQLRSAAYLKRELR